MRHFCHVLAFLLVAGLVFVDPAVSRAAPESPSCDAKRGQPAASLHGRAQRLDRELQSVLERMARGAGRGNQARWQRQAERLRDDLEALEHEVFVHGGEGEALLRDKLRALRLLVWNLERAVARGDAAGALPATGRGQRAVVGAAVTKAAVPSNDDCAGALVISEGTVVGDTSEATPDGEASCGASLYAPDVWFKYVASDWREVSVDTFESEFDTVLSVHSACPGTVANEIRCNDDAFSLQSATSFYAYSGSEYWIRLSGFDRAAGSFELHVGPGGTISGTVTAEATGDPLTGGSVVVRNAEGYWIRSDSTDGAGEYDVSSLTAGFYFLTTEGFGGYLDELYDDLPCPRGRCEVTGGTAVELVSHGSLADVDFALTLGGVVEGAVTAAANGDPIAGARVEIWSSEGSRIAYDYTDETGAYRLDGLVDGTYFVAAESSDFADELYDDVPCPGGLPYGCDSANGTPVEVVDLGTTSGIDLALERLGVVSGTVTHAASGDPLAGLRVEIWRQDGSRVASGYTGAAGGYTVGGLAEGTYIALTDSYDYADEAYDDVPCPWGYYSGCDLTAATLLEVGLNEEVSNVDFALERLGSVSGTVTVAGTGEPVTYGRVVVYDADGGYVEDDWIDSGGQYAVNRLVAGSYYVVTQTYDYLDELYDDLPCEDGCDPTAGTSVAVSLDATTSGVDFALERLGSVSGTVTVAGTGEPVYGGYVVAYRADGSYAREGWIDHAGQYLVTGLAAGSYFMVTDTYDYVDELYDDLPCESGCDPTVGTPVAVSLGATTSDVDFVLGRFGSISGTLTVAGTGEAVTYGGVQVYDANGWYVGDDWVDSAGRYSVGRLAAGTYFAIANSYDFVAELYDDLPCEDGCDPTTGTPIAVSLGATTAGIDFALDRLGSISGAVIDAATGEPIPSVDVGVWNATGSHVGWGYTDSAGEFAVTGLAPGTYFAATDNYADYLDELYDDVPCHDVGYWGDCTPTKGAPIPVEADSATEIRFALIPFETSITGKVTDASGQPLADVAVDVWDAAGLLVASTASVGTGEYCVALEPGTYFVSTANEIGLTDAVYDAVACPDGPASGDLCDPTQGTAVTVTETGAQMIALDVDFSLVSGGLIFMDGFESGDVSLWSNVVGPP